MGFVMAGLTGLMGFVKGGPTGYGGDRIGWSQVSGFLLDAGAIDSKR